MLGGVWFVVLAMNENVNAWNAANADEVKAQQSVEVASV